MSILLLIPIIGVLLGDSASAGPATVLTAYLPGDARTQLFLVILAFGALIGVRFGIVYRRDVTLARLEQEYVVHLRMRFFRSMADASWAQAAALGRGRIGHALSRDIDRASVSVGAILRGGSATMLLAVQLCLALWLAPVVAGVVLALGALAFAALAPLRRRATALGGSITREDFELFSNTQGFLRGLKSAKAHGLEDHYITTLRMAAQGYGARLVEMRRDTTLGGLSLQSAAAGLALVAVLLGHSFLDMAPEVLVVVLLLMARFGMPLQQIQMALQVLRMGEAAYRTASDAFAGLADASPGPTDPAAKPTSAPGFEFHAVTVNGDDGQPILNSITARIPAGRITAITGPSGTGKTTLCDLVSGLLVPDSGNLTIDAAPFDRARRATLSSSLAYVGQDDALLEETLRANLTLGLETWDDKAIWHALEVVGVADLVRASESGLDGKLHHDASRFSGGERQRLRLARALLRRPKLLILDEATSALDLGAEDVLLDRVFAETDGATVLMVTHRPQTAEKAHHHISIDRGRVIA